MTRVADIACVRADTRRTFSSRLYSIAGQEKALTSTAKAWDLIRVFVVPSNSFLDLL
jgi:hypothetical protein